MKPLPEMVGLRWRPLVSRADTLVLRAVARLAAQLSRPVVAVLMVAVLAIVTIGFFVRGLANPLGTDYLATITGARLLAGHQCLYCDASQIAVQSQILHQQIGRPDAYLAPPGQALLARPLLALSPWAGWLVFVGLSLAAALAGAMLGWQRLRGALPSAWPRTVLIALAVFSLPAAWNYWLAQWDALLLLAAVGSVLALDRGKPVVAGLALSALLMKPQLIWLLPIGLAVAAQWRVLAGFACGAALWAVSALTLVGDEQLSRWPAEVAARAPEIGTSVGIPGLLVTLGGDGVGTGAFLACATAAIALLWRFRVRLGTSPQTVVSLCVALSFLATPHIFAYDLVLLAVPLWILAERRAGASIACAALLSAAYVVDHFGPFSGAPFETVAVAVLVILLLSRHTRDPEAVTRAFEPTAADPIGAC